MKAAEAIFLIAVFAALVVWMVAYGISKAVGAWKSRQLSEAPWSVRENHTDPAYVLVEVAKPGCATRQIGPGIPINLPHWEFVEQKETQLAEAEALADEFNRDQKRLSRD